MINSTCVWVDNTAAIAVATGNDFTHETVKHVTVKVRFLQECVQRKIIMIVYIKTCNLDHSLGSIATMHWELLTQSPLQLQPLRRLDAGSVFVFRLAGV